MSKQIDDIIAMLQGLDDDAIAFGFIADTSEQPATARGFAIGGESQLVEGLADLMDEEHFGRILSKALAMRVKNKIINIKNQQENEKRHSSLN